MIKTGVANHALSAYIRSKISLIAHDLRRIEIYFRYHFNKLLVCVAIFNVIKRNMFLTMCYLVWYDYKDDDM